MPCLGAGDILHDLVVLPNPAARTRIYFVRHGESTANRLHVFSNRDVPHGLTAAGRAQVERLAGELCGIQFGYMYTSPVPRARETASILCARMCLAYSITPALGEIDMGVLERRSDASSWDRYRALLDEWLRK